MLTLFFVCEPCIFKKTFPYTFDICFMQKASYSGHNIYKEIRGAI